MEKYRVDTYHAAKFKTWGMKLAEKRLNLSSRVRHLSEVL